MKRSFEVGDRVKDVETGRKGRIVEQAVVSHSWLVTFEPDKANVISGRRLVLIGSRT